MTDISTIIEYDLCIACGACVHACTHDNVRIRFNELKSMYEPILLNKDGCDDCDCISVCPSNTVDYTDLSTFRFGCRPNEDIGHLDSVFLAQNINYERNLAASSGGIIKEIIRHVLSTGKVSAAIALSHSTGIAYKPVVITAPAEIDPLPGSIYHNIDYSDALGYIKELDHSFALVALPCQLEGIFLYIKKRAPELLAKIKLVIGLICGWTYTHHALRAVCAYTGTRFDQLADVSYRGGGPVGKLQLVLNDGTVKKINRRINLKYMAAFDRSFNLARCHYCVNHGNFLADIVVGDAWLPSTVMTRTGISLLISRIPAATRMLQDLKNAGRIQLCEATKNEIIESQTHRVVYGDFSYPFAEYCRANGRFAPEFTGPNQHDTHPFSIKKLKKFYRHTDYKVSLHRRGKYWKAFLYKYLMEWRPFLYRYIRWFGVRVLKLKSLTGKRKEPSSSHLKQFR